MSGVLSRRDEIKKSRVKSANLSCENSICNIKLKRKIKSDIFKKEKTEFGTAQKMFTNESGKNKREIYFLVSANMLVLA